MQPGPLASCVTEDGIIFLYEQQIYKACIELFPSF